MGSGGAPSEAPLEYLRRRTDRAARQRGCGHEADRALRAREVQRARDRPGGEGRGDRRARRAARTVARRQRPAGKARPPSRGSPRRRRVTHPFRNALPACSGRSDPAGHHGHRASGRPLARVRRLPPLPRRRPAVRAGADDFRRDGAGASRSRRRRSSPPTPALPGAGAHRTRGRARDRQRLRPAAAGRAAVRDIARHKLWTRRGIDLDEQPERARELLGPEVWGVLRAGRPEPNARYAPGADIAELRQMLERIEKV